MTDSARAPARLSIAKTWREAWRISESHPLLLLIALLLIAGTVEGCAWAMGAIMMSFPADKYGPIASWLVYVAMITLNQLLVGGVSGGIALLMLIKRAELDATDSLALRRGPVMRYFLWMSLGWLSTLFATQIIAIPLSVVFEIWTARSGQLPLQAPIYLLSSVVFAVLEAGIASFFFFDLLGILTGLPPQPRPGERARFFLISLTLFLVLGVILGVIWIFWARTMDYGESMRIIDWKYALAGWWVALLSFAVRRQAVGPQSAITSVFD